jgi:hypothetical protein
VIEYDDEIDEEDEDYEEKPRKKQQSVKPVKQVTHRVLNGRSTAPKKQIVGPYS